MKDYIVEIKISQTWRGAKTVYTERLNQVSGDYLKGFVDALKKTSKDNANVYYTELK